MRWVRAPVWLLGLVAGGLALRLGYGVATDARSLAPTSDRDRIARSLVSGLAVVMLGAWWGLGREFVGYFLPVIADWLGLALSAVAVVLLLTSLFPRADLHR